MAAGQRGIQTGIKKCLHLETQPKINWTILAHTSH
jgi:hypothetical protein